MTTSLELSPGLVIRNIAPPLQLADFKLIAFDMDSTLINIECVDEIADAAVSKDLLGLRPSEGFNRDV